MLRFTKLAFVALMLSALPAGAQNVDVATTGVELCDCLPPGAYLRLKKTVFAGGQTTVEYSSNIEVILLFLTAYGHVGAHPMNLSWPNDLAVGSADLTYLLSGFNNYPSFDEVLCNWEVVNVASHGWILEEIGAVGYSEAYVHESTYDEFDNGDQTYGQCLLNSFDLEMIYLPDSVVKISFVKGFLGNGSND